MTEHSVDQIFDDASGDIAVGDLENAAAKYQRCVEMAPDFFDGWHALGMALMKLGRFDEAIQAGKRAVELDRMTRSAGQVFRSFTIAPATSKKPKQQGRRRRY